MRLLVLGAGGMLGSDLVRSVEPDEVTALAREELDVTVADAVERALEQVRPDVVINCAAYTDVDGAESEPELAMAVNGDGAGHVARAAAAVGAKAVYVSSDYVFDGLKLSPYLESDRTGPLSSYGRSKLAGEEATLAAAPQHVVARSSWLFGLGGRNFVETMLRLGREREIVRVVDDQRGCPTFTPHLASALHDLVSLGAQGVHHVAGSGACTWFELAAAVFEGAELPARLEPCSSEEMPRPASRPANSVLESERPRTPRLPDWREGLAAYLAEREVRAA